MKLMAIEKNYVKSSASRFESEFSVGSRSRESMSSDDDELRRRNSLDSEDDDDEYDDADSGAGSDDFDLLELGETRSEFCQVGDQTCSIPFELYDLPHLHDILSLDVWNDCLTEEERFGLSKYLPDMDQEAFMRTLKDLFQGTQFHFDTPITKLYQMLKGGLCEPRVSLYRQGLSFFQKHKHYHLLRNHHESMVASFLQIKESWQTYKGYSIEDKLRVLSIMRSQTILMGERNEEMGSDSSGRQDSGGVLFGKRFKGGNTRQKAGQESLYAASASFDALPQGNPVGVDFAKYGKKNAKKMPRLVGSKTSSMYETGPLVHSHRHGYQSLKYDAYGSELGLPRGGKAPIHDAMTELPVRERMASSDPDQEVMYGRVSQRDWNVSHCSVMDRGRSAKSGKKRDALRVGEYDGHNYSPFPPKNDFCDQGRNLNINQLSDIKVLTAKPSNSRALYDHARNAKYVELEYEDQIRSAKGRAKQAALKASMAGVTDIDGSYWNKNSQGEAYFIDPLFDYEDMDVSSRKLKIGREFPDSRLKSLQTSHHQMDDSVYNPKKRSKLLQENIKEFSLQNGGSTMIPINSGRMFHEGEETESNSSDQRDEEDDDGPLILTKLGMQGHFENSRSLPSSFFDWKEKRAKKDVKGSASTLDGIVPVSSTMGDFGRNVQMPEIEPYSSKNRLKAKVQYPDDLENVTSRVPEDGYYGGFGNKNTESSRKSFRRTSIGAQLQAELVGSPPIPMKKGSPAYRRQKRDVGRDFSGRQSKYLQGYTVEENGGLFETDPVQKGARNSDSPLTGLTSSFLKQKGMEGSVENNGGEGSDYTQSHQQLIDSFALKKWVKMKSEVDGGSLDAGASELPVPEIGMADLEQESNPPKKTFILITPTIHSDFSFSVIHLLSAVRMALLTPNNIEDSSEVGKDKGNSVLREEDGNRNQELMNGSTQQLDVKNAGQHAQTNSPSHTVQEIVNHVRSNPGDPCILETQEPLLDLVRGVMKLFSSRTAPLGAKGWKPLVCYEKATKSWTWIGPLPQSSTEQETVEDVLSPDAWRIPHKMLVKLVDSFANWLKSGQETLRQIGSLPAPPLELMQLNFDEKERFRDLRAQKSLSTISKSSEEVRAYFRKEEQLRYSVPDRAFSYTAADGKKSIVAPLRRCGGKPTSKARDHFMLKRDRPPHVTILCLVRDAASRLPGSVGTRADVCTLIRDSQYIVEDVSDAQVNQVVSGALDRLHYERDPCVQFDGERKLWVYLHREREEEDFEDDGTSSTKKWKRQKKDVPEPVDQVTVACHMSGEPSVFDLSSDLNAEPSCVNNEKILEVCDDARQRTEDDVKTTDMAVEGNVQQLLESKLQCQENSANEDFDGFKPNSWSSCLSFEIVLYSEGYLVSVNISLNFQDSSLAVGLPVQVLKMYAI